MFDMHIDLGNVLTLVGMLAALWRFHTINTKRIHGMEFKVGLMWKHFARRFDLPEKLEELEEEHL